MPELAPAPAPSPVASSPERADPNAINDLAASGGTEARRLRGELNDLCPVPLLDIMRVGVLWT